MAENKKMVSLIIGILAIVIAISAVVWYFVFLQHANPPLRENELRIGNNIFTVEIASTTAEQSRGLSFRAGLADGHGMFFPFSSPGVQHFWMKDMNFAIDMIWIAGNKVVGFAENAAPEPGVSLFNLKIYNSPDGTDSVLEVPAGAVAKDGIKEGDIVQVGKLK